MEGKKVGRPFKIKNDEKDNEILVLLEKGLKQIEIANILGVSSFCISFRIKKMKQMGINIPKKKKRKHYFKKNVNKDNDKIQDKEKEYYNYNIAKKIVDLINTKSASLEQVKSIAKIYQVDKEVDELLKILDDKER